MTLLVAKLFASYLLGSVMGGLVVGRWRGGVDIRELGSGNAGGTNALRTQGWRFAVAVMAIDVGKAVLAESKRQGSILVSGARVIAASEFDPPSAVLGPKVSIGLACAPAKDDRGHEALKILVIIGQ